MAFHEDQVVSDPVCEVQHDRVAIVGIRAQGCTNTLPLVGIEGDGTRSWGVLRLQNRSNTTRQSSTPECIFCSKAHVLPAPVPDNLDMAKEHMACQSVTESLHACMHPIHAHRVEGYP